MRKVADCRLMPSESNCTLTISGEQDEVLRTAVEHAISAHGHAESAELRDGIRSMLADEGSGAAIVKAGYEAFARGDIPALRQLLADDLVWTESPHVPLGGTHRGAESVLESWSHLPEHYSEITPVAETVLEQGATVVVLGRFLGRTLSGNALDLPFVDVFTVRDGKITSGTEHYDTAQMNALLGVPAQRAASQGATQSSASV